MRINQVDIGSLFLMADSKKRSRDDFEEDIQLALALSLPPEMISPDPDDTEDDCGGSCLAGLFEFTGDPSEKPSLTLPNGGWGYTPCCHTPVHYECMGKHLNPTGKIVESSRGPVKINLCCPFCKKTISRSTSRMLTI